MNKLLILDRDGVINIEYGHIFKQEDFRFMPGIFDFCKKYQDLGYKIVVASNQSGIAKGLFTMEDYKRVNYFMIDEFKAHGIEIAKTYVCPHSDSYNCDCHKPKPGMILEAIKDFDADLKESVGVGDKMSDLDAYKAAGIKKLIFLKGENEPKKAPYKYRILKELK